MQKTLPYLLVVAAATCWGMTGLFVRIMMPMGFSQLQILFVRCLIPVILLGAWMLLTDRQAFKFRLRDCWMFLGSGLLSLTCFGVAYFTSMTMMPLSVAAVLLYTGPVWVMLISAVLFKERITPAKVIALMLVIVGACCTTGVITGVAAIPGLGLVLGLIAGFGYALYTIFGRYALNAGYKSSTISFYTLLLATIALVFITDVPAIPALLDAPARWVLIVVVGLVSGLAPYLLYTKGLQGMENSTASILATTEMLVATIISAVFFHEPFGFLNALGFLLVLGGIVVMNVRFRRKPRREMRE